MTLATQQQGEPTQDELTRQQQEGPTRGNGGGEKICVKHQGKLQTMTERDLKHMTSNDGSTYMVHCGKIMNPQAIDRLRDNAIVHVVNKMPEGG